MGGKGVVPVSILWECLPMQLDTVASLSVGDKICVVDGALQVDPPRATRAVSRYLRGDYGLESVVWVEYVVLCTLEAIRDRREREPRGVKALRDKLYRVHGGLRKLAKTYEGDCAIAYKIAAMCLLIGRFAEEGGGGVE